jgi:hypothetical protein
MHQLMFDGTNEGYQKPVIDRQQQVFELPIDHTDIQF